jgi:rhodanese-related sulfurtransferase
VILQIDICIKEKIVMIKNIFPKVGAAVMILLASVMALMGSPTTNAPLKTTENLGELISYGDDKISPVELSEMIIEEEPGLYVVDIRDEGEFALASIANSINMPISTLLSNDGIDELPPNGKIILICGDGTRSSQAWVVLRSKGFDTYLLDGGINGWVTMLEGTPEETQPHLAARLNAIRSHFLGGPGLSDSAPVVAAAPIKAAPKNKKKRKKKEGGC